MYSSKQKTIIYLMYGHRRFKLQALFSILTLYYYIQMKLDQYQILIYTDNDKTLKKYLGNIPITIEHLSPEKIEDYKGKMKYKHRIKICVIKDALQKYKNDILFLDTDTFFLKNPLPLINKISEEVSIMNEPEYDMQDRKFESCDMLTLRRSLEDPVTLNGKTFIIPFSTIQWNSGLVGISYKNLHLLEDIVSINDQLYTNRPVFFVEQFAIGYILQTRTNLICSEDYIKHYWRAAEKDIMNYHLKRFFWKNKKKQIKELAKEAFELAQQHKALKLPEPTLLDKILLRIKLIFIVAVKGRIEWEL